MFWELKLSSFLLLFSLKLIKNDEKNVSRKEIKNMQHDLCLKKLHENERQSSRDGISRKSCNCRLHYYIHYGNQIDLRKFD